MKLTPLAPEVIDLLGTIAEREGVTIEALLRREFMPAKRAAFSPMGEKPQRERPTSKRVTRARRDITVQLRFTARQFKALHRGARAAGVTDDHLAEEIAQDLVDGMDEAFIEEGGHQLLARCTPDTRSMADRVAELRRQDEAAVAASRSASRARGEIGIEVNAATMKAIARSADAAGCTDGQLVGFIMEALDRDLIAETATHYRDAHAGTERRTP